MVITGNKINPIFFQSGSSATKTKIPIAMGSKIGQNLKIIQVIDTPIIVYNNLWKVMYLDHSFIVIINQQSYQ